MLKRVNSEWGPLMKGEEYNKELIMEFYIEMAGDIRRQRERIGGDWAVAAVLISRAARDHLRKILGPDLVIVCLTMSDSDRRERVLGRHQGDVNAADLMDVSRKYLQHTSSYSLFLAFRQSDGTCWGG